MGNGREGEWEGEGGKAKVPTEVGGLGMGEWGGGGGGGMGERIEGNSSDLHFLQNCPKPGTGHAMNQRETGRQRN